MYNVCGIIYKSHDSHARTVELIVLESSVSKARRNSCGIIDVDISDRIARAIVRVNLLIYEL